MEDLKQIGKSLEELNLKLEELIKYRDAIDYCLQNQLTIPADWVEMYNRYRAETRD